jgi:hypothetical protein
MPTHIAFPEIGQYRNAIRPVKERAQYTGKNADGSSNYDALLPMPTLSYSGTVKLHGTNAAVCLNRTNGDIWFQSRERIITYADDNMGFVRENKPRLTADYSTLAVNSGKLLKKATALHRRLNQILKR